MQKRIIPAAVLVAMGIVSLLSLKAHAADGTITINSVGHDLLDQRRRGGFAGERHGDLAHRSDGLAVDGWRNGRHVEPRRHPVDAERLLGRSDESGRTLRKRPDRRPEQRQSAQPVGWLARTERRTASAERADATDQHPDQRKQRRRHQRRGDFGRLSGTELLRAVLRDGQGAAGQCELDGSIHYAVSVSDGWQDVCFDKRLAVRDCFEDQL
jgi:hypothetical protein